MSKSDHPSLFDTLFGPQAVNAEPEKIAGMVHKDDPHTSIDAACVIERKRTELHARVIAAFQQHGRMTDEELEELPEFADFGPSTIRKRRSELFQQGALVSVGDKTNSRGRKMVVWELV